MLEVGITLYMDHMIFNNFIYGLRVDTCDIDKISSIQFSIIQKQVKYVFYVLATQFAKNWIPTRFQKSSANIS